MVRGVADACSSEDTVLSRFAYGILLGVIVYLLLQAFLGWP